MAISFEAVGMARSPLYLQCSSYPVSEAEALLDRLCAFGGRRDAGIELQVVVPAAMQTVILPARQADQAVAARPLACFQHIQRREHADRVERRAREQRPILRQLVPE